MLNPSATFAHEFGPFAIDRYAAIRVAPDEIELDYVLSLAETPTQADGEAIEADPEAYCTSLATDIELLVDDTALDTERLDHEHAAPRGRRRADDTPSRVQLGHADRGDRRRAHAELRRRELQRPRRLA